tara:strand:+ start:6451 stop:7038 length:588 start_codon:yes stop_codon:yes gene_type:complete
MLRIIIIFIFVLNLQSLTKADDISDFEIDGISIGDSLLDYYSKNEINEMLSKTVSTYTNMEIKRVFFKSINGSNYLQYNFHYINDKSYEIVNIKGIMLMENKTNECNAKKLQVSKEIENSINFKDKQKSVQVNGVDKSGKSTIDSIKFIVDGGSIEVECWKWSKKIKEEKPWRDTFQVSILDDIFIYWLNNKAFK